MPDFLSIETWRTLFTKHGSKLGWGLALLFGAPLVIGFGVSQYANRNTNLAAANADRGAVVAAINGVPITRQQYDQAAFQDRSQSGEAAALAQGGAIQSLAQRIVIEQEAASRNVRASDAEIDSQVEKIREDRLGKDDAKDSGKWSAFLTQSLGMTTNEFRENVAKQMLAPALVNSYKSDFTVTEADAKNQSAEVKLQVVFIGIKNQFSAINRGKGAQPLDEASAKAKADELFGKAKGGADLTEMAKTNSTDPLSSPKGGVIDFRPEYTISQGQDSALGYGKEFDATVHKTAVGQLTDLAKSGGFNAGYLFAKVVERRNTLPKDFNAAKVIEALKQKKAEEKATEIIRDKTKAAKIEIKDPKIKTYYDYFRLSTAKRAEMMAQFGQEEAKKDVLPKAELDKLTASTEAGFETILKSDPSDITAAQLLAQTLKQKLRTDATRDRLISLDETILKGTENQQTRLELASLYREKKDLVKAKEQYDQIAKIQGRKPVYNTASAQEAKTTYTSLVSSYKSVNAPEDAAKMDAKLAEVNKKALDYQLKDLKDKQAPQSMAPPLTPSTPTVTTTPAPSPADAKAGDKK